MANVQYVYGVPPQTPVLKGLRQKLYDRERIVGGRLPGAQFFVDCRKTADGRVKDQSFTNLWQSGQLGYPLEYDLVTVGVYPVSGDPEYTERYNRFASSDAVLRWFFGANVPWLTIPLALMKRSPVAESFIRDEATGEPYRIVVRNGAVTAEKLTSPVRMDHETVVRVANMTSLDKKMRRISSTESFRVEIATPDRDGPYDMDVFVAMDGIYWCQL
jgi:hypothetical protein